MTSRLDTDFHLDRSSVRVARTAIGPVRIDDGSVRLRLPRLTDGPAWRATSLREEGRLRDVFGSPDEPWSDTVSLTAWADRVAHQRAAARAGRLVPYVAVHDDGRMAGEISFAIDPRTGTAEISLWLDSVLPKTVRSRLIGLALLRIFSLPQQIDRVVAPVAVDNPGPPGVFEQLGFTRQARARELRLNGGARVDHDIWWLDRGDDPVAALGADVPRHRAGPTSSTWLFAAVVQMAPPAARVVVRRARSRRASADDGSWAHHVGSRVVLLRHDGPGVASVDGHEVGTTDIRHDLGSSTLEVWTDLHDVSAAEAVATAAEALAHDVGAHRLAWSLRPASVEEGVASRRGLRREGRVTEPLALRGQTHDLWASIVAR